MVKSLKERFAGFVLQHGLLLLALNVVTPLILAEGMTDPTRPPEAFGLVRDATVAAVAAAPKLQSVLISRGRKIALINGQAFKLGDQFEEMEIVRISEREVVLRKGKELQTLKIY